jgi:hypothetical protein
MRHGASSDSEILKGERDGGNLRDLAVTGAGHLSFEIPADDVYTPIRALARIIFNFASVSA